GVRKRRVVWDLDPTDGEDRRFEHASKFSLVQLLPRSAGRGVAAIDDVDDRPPLWEDDRFESKRLLRVDWFVSRDSVQRPPGRLELLIGRSSGRSSAGHARTHRLEIFIGRS